MIVTSLRRLLLCCALFYASAATASSAFSFGVIAPAAGGTAGESALRAAIAETDADNLAFVVTGGIKAGSEACADGVYQRRKALLDAAKNGLVVSLAGDDWTGCRHPNGKSAAIGRLNQLRDLFFNDEFSIGASRIPLMRQSANPKFRNYSENARWEVGDTMFATINLPAPNNNYLVEAGRNNEFEDRVVANRDWLHRLFTHASRKKMTGIVLFSDGNPFAAANRRSGGRDGFAEVRQQLQSLARNFPGRVLLIHGGMANGSSPIDWRGNIGVLPRHMPWMRITVDPASQTMFAVETEPAEMKPTKE